MGCRSHTGVNALWTPISGHISTATGGSSSTCSTSKDGRATISSGRSLFMINFLACDEASNGVACTGSNHIRVPKAQQPYQHDESRNHHVPRLTAQLLVQHHFHKRGKQVSQQNCVAYQRQVGHANHLEGMMAYTRTYNTSERTTDTSFQCSTATANKEGDTHLTAQRWLRRTCIYRTSHPLPLAWLAAAATAQRNNRCGKFYHYRYNNCTCYM